MDNKRKAILGVPVDALNSEEFLSCIEDGLEEPGMKTIFAVNAEKIMAARKDPELLAILKESDYLLPDGFGPVVGLRLIHKKKVDRTTGVRLMVKLLALAEAKQARVFIFGAKPDIVKLAEEKIRKKHPSLNLIGVDHGYIQNNEYKSFIKRINSLKPDILFVGLGSPKQEKWISQHKESINAKVCLGVGGSIDVFAGEVSLAPEWISRIYLEWLYRLLKQPSRIKRQKVIPIFILLILKDALFRRYK